VKKTATEEGVLYKELFNCKRNRKIYNSTNFTGTAITFT
jgi:hypothetical protein